MDIITYVLQYRVALIFLFTSLVISLATVVLYNLYFHPLAKFPGPRIAAATRWYEFHHEIYRGGRFYEVVDDMHDQYGPIVRVNPFELHIKDPSYYDTLLNFNSELDKRAFATENLQNSPSFQTHHAQRKAFDPFFSRGSIQKIEWLVRDSVDKLCNILREYRGQGEPVNVSNLYRCLTADIISEYSFSQSYALLDDHLKHQQFMESITGTFKLLFFIREIVITRNIINALETLPTWLHPPSKVGEFISNWQKVIRDRLSIVAEKEQEPETSGHKTIFHYYRLNPSLPPEENTAGRQFSNALMLVSAGFETTGLALSAATYHVLSSPTTHSRLRKELAAACPPDNELLTGQSWRSCLF